MFSHVSYVYNQGLDTYTSVTHIRKAVPVIISCIIHNHCTLQVRVADILWVNSVNENFIHNMTAEAGQIALRSW